MKIETTIVAAWSEIGRWHTGPGAPNGCMAGGPERRLVTIEVYSADYYGNGSKLYMRGRTLLQYTFQGQFCYSPPFGHFDDGNLDRIAARMSQAGVSL